MVYFFTKLLQGTVWLFMTVVGGFIWYVDICDAILTMGFLWLLTHKIYGWNGWWALAFGILVSLIFYIIFKHRIGFWIVAPIFSAIWTIVFGAIVQSLFPTLPQILLWIICIMHFALGVRLHAYARDRAAIDFFAKAEEAERKRQEEENWQ